MAQDWSGVRRCCEVLVASNNRPKSSVIVYIVWRGMILIPPLNPRTKTSRVVIVCYLLALHHCSFPLLMVILSAPASSWLHLQHAFLPSNIATVHKKFIFRKGCLIPYLLCFRKRWCFVSIIIIFTNQGIFKLNVYLLATGDLDSVIFRGHRCLPYPSWFEIDLFYYQ